MGLLGSIKKNYKLSRLMKRLGKASRKAFSAENNLENAIERVVSGEKSNSEVAEEELYDLIENDSDLGQILNAYGANRDTLKYIYSTLRLSGAGQWVRGAYVPAAALATNPTLDFVLRECKNSKFDEHNKWLYIGSELIDYFESGRLGPVN